ncbi:MAG TPA: hypothetical protein VM580_16575, partial [Labilithrix sp.]|nr:hypothetical protein [Labilithrix sp.]
LAAGIEARAKSASAKLAEAFRGASPPREQLMKLLPLLGELRFYWRFLDEVEAIEEEAEEALAGASVSIGGAP